MFTNIFNWLSIAIVSAPLTHRILLDLEWFSLGAFIIALSTLKTVPMLATRLIGGPVSARDSL